MPWIEWPAVAQCLWRPLPVVALLLSLATSHVARANGPELLPGGTRAVGRAGAVAARPTDPMAMLTNPAGLPRLSGDQVMLNLDFAFHDMCVDPYGFYGWGISPQQGSSPSSDFGSSTDEDYLRRPLDTVCNSAPVLPLPQLAWAFHLTDSLSMALGFVAPTVVPGMQFGGPNGSIQTGDGGRPTPTRYQLIRQKIEFGLNPTASIAYRFSDLLSVGLTAQVLMVRASAYAMATFSAGTDPSDDMLSKLTVEDYFIPSGVLSVHSEPLPGLSLMGAFRAYDSIDGSGEVQFTTGHYQRDLDGAEANAPAAFENDPISLSRVKIRIPWTLTAAIRYADLLPSPDGEGPKRGDPLDTERWDVELDFTWHFNERVGRNTVEFGEDIELNFRRSDGMPRTPAKQTVDDLEEISVDRNLRDSLALRLGGSYHPLPGRLGFNAGVFFENRGIDPAYASVDSFAFNRLGLGVGAVLRLGDFDLLLSYSHIFQETVEVAPPAHAPASEADPDDPTSGFDQRIAENGSVEGVQDPTPDPRAPDPADADGIASYQQAAAFETGQRRRRTVNAGRYRASFDVLSVGVVYRF